MVVKFLLMLSFTLVFTGLSLMSVSALDTHNQMLMAEALFQTCPHHWSQLD